MFLGRLSFFLSFQSQEKLLCYNSVPCQGDTALVTPSLLLTGCTKSGQTQRKASFVSYPSYGAQEGHWKDLLFKISISSHLLNFFQGKQKLLEIKLQVNQLAVQKNAAKWSSWVCLHSWLTPGKVLCKPRQENVIWPSSRKRAFLMNRWFPTFHNSSTPSCKMHTNFFKLVLFSSLTVNTLLSKLALTTLIGNIY